LITDSHCSACGLNIDDYIDEFGDDDRTSDIDEYDFIAEAD
jgi:hypothetical protein